MERVVPVAEFDGAEISEGSADQHFGRRVVEDQAPVGVDREGGHRQSVEQAPKQNDLDRVTLAFRDALRRDPQTATEYSELKLELASRYPRDRIGYLEGKSAFIARVLAATEEGADGPAL